ALTGTLTVTSDDPAHATSDVSLTGAGAPVTLVNEEISTDDGTLEIGVVGDGVIVVNRFTPARYPATLQKARLWLTQYKDLPSPAGVTVRFVVFADPTGSGAPPASRTLLLDRMVALPAVPGT